MSKRRAESDKSHTRKRVVNKRAMRGQAIRSKLDDAARRGVILNWHTKRPVNRDFGGEWEDDDA